MSGRFYYDGYMEISTKYKIGDEVYVIKSNRICKCNIVGVRIDVRKTLTGMGVRVNESYSVNIDQYELYEDVFASFDQAVGFLRESLQ